MDSEPQTAQEAFSAWWATTFTGHSEAWGCRAAFAAGAAWAWAWARTPTLPADLNESSD